MLKFKKDVKNMTISAGWTTMILWGIFFGLGYAARQVKPEYSHWNGLNIIAFIVAVIFISVAAYAMGMTTTNKVLILFWIIFGGAYGIIYLIKPEPAQLNAGAAILAFIVATIATTLVAYATGTTTKDLEQT
jgi:hypothetical protein